MAFDKEQTQLLGEIKSDTEHIRELLSIQNGRLKKVEDKIRVLELTKNYVLGIIVATGVFVGFLFNTIKVYVLKAIGVA